MSHHPALVWDLREEDTNSTAQQKAFARYIRELDPNDHPIVVDTYRGQYEKIDTPLLGFDAIADNRDGERGWLYERGGRLRARG